ncbi:hypothetical protein XELAEV_18017324mg [Xenopus laevis]|uniref:Uncharacterized protein n=1 Tax=Xenopus laevis TaxID=8355 RepID=A0A974DB37_XENLA|nr:hypothetical protein XELAEV_18017324mg [Xenopus laevis]
MIIERQSGVCYLYRKSTVYLEVGVESMAKRQISSSELGMSIFFLTHFCTTVTILLDTELFQSKWPQSQLFSLQVMKCPYTAFGAGKSFAQHCYRTRTDVSCFLVI